jgi:hypothetical protein
VIWTRKGTEETIRIVHILREVAVITLNGNSERHRESVCTIHNALKYPDDALLSSVGFKGYGGRRSCVLETVAESGK